MNSVNVIGNLVRDFEVKYTANGTAVTDNAVAINERFGDQEYTSFVDLKLFGKQAETAGEYLHKGRKVGITGRLRQNKWSTDSGEKRSKLIVIVDRWEFLDSRKKEDSENTTTNVVENQVQENTPF